MIFLFFLELTQLQNDFQILASRNLFLVFTNPLIFKSIKNENESYDEQAPQYFIFAYLCNQSLDKFTILFVGL